MSGGSGIFRLALALGALVLVVRGQTASEPPPKGKKLTALVRAYLEADDAGRSAIRADLDGRIAPLEPRDLPKLRREILKAAARVGPRFESGRRSYLYGEKTEKPGKYLVSGSGKTLVIALHGGGLGSGSAESAAGAMGGGRGRTWVYPEVLEKTEHGWTTSGTEEFVVELIDAAKRSGRFDPNRIYITGHSMGGYGTWTLGAHHADVFAGGAAYAGAPTPYFAGDGSKTVEGIETGVIPNWFNNPLFVFQSTDDPRVPPRVNIFAAAELGRWQALHPTGFVHRYVQVDDREHAAPKEGYGPSLAWIMEHERDPRPRELMWQPTLAWKHQFYWLYWHRPALGDVIKGRVLDDNVIEITTIEANDEPRELSVLLGEPLVDLEREVCVRIDGKERFRGRVTRSLSTLLLTCPRHDPELLFDARVDL